MKYDFSTPLTDEQLQVVRWVQENGDDVVKAGRKFDLDPTDAFKWTIQDYELRREPLRKKGEAEGMTDELFDEINTIYEKEVTLRKIWDEFVKGIYDSNPANK